jgi:hypothetical protein
VIVKNVSPLSDRFVRKCVEWCCDQTSWCPQMLHSATFGNRFHPLRWWNGRAWYYRNLPSHSRIGVKVNWQRVTTIFPYKLRQHGLVIPLPSVESLVVFVVAHELQHLVNHNTRLPNGRTLHADLCEARDLERHCHRTGLRVQSVFEANRTSLLEDWNG